MLEPFINAKSCGKLKIAVSCSSNMNRSMEAHYFLKLIFKIIFLFLLSLGNVGLMSKVLVLEIMWSCLDQVLTNQIFTILIRLLMMKFIRIWKTKIRNC